LVARCRKPNRARRAQRLFFLMDWTERRWLEGGNLILERLVRSGEEERATAVQTVRDEMNRLARGIHGNDLSWEVCRDLLTHIASTQPPEETPSPRER